MVGEAKALALPIISVSRWNFFQKKTMKKQKTRHFSYIDIQNQEHFPSQGGTFAESVVKLPFLDNTFSHFGCEAGRPQAAS